MLEYLDMLDYEIHENQFSKHIKKLIKDQSELDFDKDFIISIKKDSYY